MISRDLCSSTTSDTAPGRLLVSGGAGHAARDCGCRDSLIQGQRQDGSKFLGIDPAVLVDAGHREPDDRADLKRYSWRRASTRASSSSAATAAARAAGQSGATPLLVHSVFSAPNRRTPTRHAISSMSASLARSARTRQRPGRPIHNQPTSRSSTRKVWTAVRHPCSNDVYDAAS